MPITIDKPSKYFNTLTWTGDGTNNRSITGVGFRPELAWTKRRDSAQGNTNHNIWDFVRGAGNNSELSSNSGVAEGDSGASEYGYISALNSDGFTLTDGTDATYKNLYTNNNGGTYVSWNWLANGTGVSNTAGTISSTVSANTTSGFSIVSYTGNATAGATVGHGLGAVPKMIIIKPRTITENWATYHASLGNANNVTLNTTNASGGTSDYNSTSPTSSVFSLGSGSGTNGSGNTLIAYCFAEVKGFSKAFSYVGNGSSDGTYVHLGFRPAWVMIKYSSGASESWAIFDNKRNVYNPESLYLYANTSGSEGTETGGIDFLSNGFKIRNSYGYTNNSGGTYIGFAVAENPFVSSKGVAVTAR